MFDRSGMPPPRPPRPILPARPPIICFMMPPLPLPPMAFIMSAMPRCIFRSLLISAASVPEPAAMRFFRLCFRISGLARSALVIDEMMAIWRSNILSLRPAEAILSFMPAMPGISPMMPPMPPIFFIWASWSERSLRSNLPLAIFSAMARAFSASMFSAAFSTSETMSPMPRIRSAIRRGWNSSSSFIRSPIPISLIGLPVTARMERAAPPRPSPSIRVSTRPVMPTRSSKLRARLTAS
ncbi:hypothetical protein D3C78_1270700 [compost metagenome]